MSATEAEVLQDEENIKVYRVSQHQPKRNTRRSSWCTGPYEFNTYIPHRHELNVVDSIAAFHCRGGERYFLFSEIIGCKIDVVCVMVIFTV